MAEPRTTLVRDAGIVAAFDLRESLRTRRALVLIVLYLLGATVTAYGYVRVVREVEEQIARTMAEAKGEQAAGAALAVGLVRSEGYRSALRFFAGGDDATANHLASIPPMVLVFVWCSLTFLPWLISLTSYDQVAGDLHLRTVRYVALRTSRPAFVLGKLGAQAALFAAVSALTMAPVFLLGWAYLDTFDPWATGRALAASWPLTVLYASAFIGATSLASQLCRTPGTARAAAVGVLFALWLLGLGRTWQGAAGWRGLVAPVSYLSPWAYKAGLFRASLLARAGSGVACVALGAGYAALGYLRFRRRDL